MTEEASAALEERARRVRVGAMRRRRVDCIMVVDLGFLDTDTSRTYVRNERYGYLSSNWIPSDFFQRGRGCWTVDGTRIAHGFGTVVLMESGWSFYCLFGFYF